MHRVKPRSNECQEIAAVRVRDAIRWNGEEIETEHSGQREASRQENEDEE
jgi:hypothetical protein